jgi:ApaG protein
MATKFLFPYAETTAGITVRVAPRYLPEQSNPSAGRYVWSYHIRIENQSDRTVQLIARHWIITDGLGRVEEVQGEGVVGEQPVLDPGDTFDYVSGCPLTTPTGTMRGEYAMAADGEMFEIAIPAFPLVQPTFRPTLN